MAEKKAFVLRINPDLLKEIELWAAAEFRSTNGQIEFLMSKSLAERKKSNKTIATSKTIKNDAKRTI
jgi:hypothetical protein